MTSRAGSTGTARSARSPAPSLGGGIGLVIAGALQLIAAVRFLVPAAPEWITPLWQLVGWLLGAVVLLAAAVLLSVGRRGAAGVVGASRLGRTALIVSGASGLLDLGVVVLAFTGTEARPAPADAALVVVQLVVLAATAIAAVAVARARVLSGAARWALLPVAAVDAVSAALVVTASTGPGFLASAYVVRPALLLLAGLAYALHGRAGDRAAAPPPG